MRTRTILFFVTLPLALVLPALHGQDRAPVQPVSHVQPPRDLAKLTVLQQQMLLCAQRGADWLRRANGPDGRFTHGYLPDLKVPLEGDSYMRQAEAAFALARAARVLNNERYLAVVRQAMLTLLLETATDSADPKVRYTTPPAVLVNRLGGAGLLVLAVSELPNPGDDLLEPAEQLCNYLRKQQQADGSLKADDDAAPEHAGTALYALMLSQRHRPAAWKTDVVRKAVAYYRPYWRAQKSMAFVPTQTAAYSEAYLRVKEPAFAEFVFEMNDWLCTQQYVDLDPRHPLWTGGFKGWANNVVVPSEPKAVAAYAESLAEAARVARHVPDVQRHQRYREALERSLQFISTLQYTDGNTQHFADWYRPVLLGGFHASHQDGSLRLDYTAHAVSAMVQYLTHGGE